MVTALNEAADFERGVQAGTDDFLTKPVNKVELLCRIRSMLRVRHLKTQLDRTLAYLAEFEAASRAADPGGVNASVDSRFWMAHRRPESAGADPESKIPMSKDLPAVSSSSRAGLGRSSRAIPGCSTPRSIASRGTRARRRGRRRQFASGSSSLGACTIPASAIRVRLYRWDDGPLDESFWAHRLEAACGCGRDLLRLGTSRTAFRLVFSEGDGLSGLTVDRYDRWLVAQFTSLALYHRRELFLRLLRDLTGVEGILARTERGIASERGLQAGEETIVGSVPDGPVEIVENDLRYRVDLRSGQKTGFYLDQRENRRAVAGYCRGKRVLDLFCFTGAFSLGAIQHGGAVEALGIDSSASAIERAREHATINGIERARFEAGDVLKVLEGLRLRGSISTW